MIVPDEDEDGMQYFDDDIGSLSSQNASDFSDTAEGTPFRSEDSAISVDAFSGFRSLPNTTTTSESLRLHAGAGDSFGSAVVEENKGTQARLQPEGGKFEREPAADIFGRHTAKGRSNWFISEYGSIFRLMDGDMLPRDTVKPVRKATSDIKYIKQLYTKEMSLAELSVGEDPRRVAWGTLFRGEPDAWNLWNSEMELSTLTTLDVQRNVAAAVNSRRRMKWAIGVERNGMVTGVAFNEEQKDILRQAIDFALSREFVPELDPRIVKLEFVRVSAVSGDRCLILISINSLIETLHQLSSGRIFYLMGDKVVMAESINQIRLALEQRRKYDEQVKERGLGERKKRGLPKWMIGAAGVVLVAAAAYAVRRYAK